MLPEIRTAIPGPQSRQLAATLRDFESPNITFLSESFPIFWERADGANVWDVDGNRFLDLTSAFAVTGLGHGAPAVRDALIAQSGRLMHAMGDVHPTREKAELCRLLSRVTFERWNAGTGRTILGCSGSDAVEAALKTALLFTNRRGVVAFEGGYHGLGMGALDTTGMSFFSDPFRAQLADFSVHATYPRDSLEANRDELRKVLATGAIGAVLVEPVQGRGGEVVPANGFLAMLRSLCDEFGALLIADEIYTGFHRTGRLFACEHSAVVPDLICLGKGLTSGFPLSACVGRSEIMEAWPRSHGEALHTSTFLGNPMGCAMAIASVTQHLDPTTERQVSTVSDALDRALRRVKSSSIREMRGIGLMRGIEFVTNNGAPNCELAAEIVTRGLGEGLLFLAGSPTGNVLSLTPPFCIKPDEIEFAVSRIQEYVVSRAGSIS